MIYLFVLIRPSGLYPSSDCWPTREDAGALTEADKPVPRPIVTWGMEQNQSKM